MSIVMTIIAFSFKKACTYAIISPTNAGILGTKKQYPRGTLNNAPLSTKSLLQPRTRRFLKRRIRHSCITLAKKIADVKEKVYFIVFICKFATDGKSEITAVQKMFCRQQNKHKRRIFYLSFYLANKWCRLH